jgi:hypothetical protein
MSQLKLNIESPLGKKARKFPLFFIRDGYVYHPTTDPSNSSGLYIECGLLFNLQKFENLFAVEKHTLLESHPELQRFGNDYIKAIHDSGFAAIKQDGETAHDLHLFLTALIPMYKRERLNSVAPKTASSDLSGVFASCVPEAAGVIDCRIYTLLQSVNGAIRMGERKYSWTNKAQTISAFESTYRSSLEQVIKAEIENVSKAGTNFSDSNTTDLSMVCKIGSRYEYSDIGYDTNLHMFFLYISSFVHSNGTTYGNQQIAFAAPIQGKRLMTNSIVLVEKNGNGEFSRTGESICQSKVQVRGNLSGLSYDFAYMKQLATDVSKNGYFHEYRR